MRNIGKSINLAAEHPIKIAEQRAATANSVLINIMHERMETREQLADFAQVVLGMIEGSPETAHTKIDLMIRSAVMRGLATTNGSGHFRRLDK